MSSISGRDNGEPPGVIPVIVLNWNGEQDTLECLKSMRQSAPAGFVPVLVDNGSEPESVERLTEGCSLIYERIRFLNGAELAALDGQSRAELAVYLREDSLVFIQNGENLGFAKGNNVGVRLAELIGAEWVMLLNNDTVVSPQLFRELRAFLNSYPSFLAITPQIRYFEPRTRIQNCGGDLTYFGSRRYRFANRDASAVSATGHSVISFVTGCALLFKYTVVGALTEQFFFGEEDYEFSLRMRKLGLPMACVHGAVVYHKVGASITRSSRPFGAILANYVTRLVNVRQYYSQVRWHATRLLAYLYLPVLLAKNGIDPRKSISTIRRVESYLKTHHAVGRAEFQAMVSSDE